jgi:FkbM family methyltransferase
MRSAVLQWNFNMVLKLLINQNITGSRSVQAVVRNFYPIGKICTVHRGPLKGLRFRVAKGMGFTYAWGIGAEQWEFDGLVRTGMCVYDVGANCGQSTLSLARLVGAAGRVIAFEPVDSVFANLVFNVRLNSFLQVTPVCAAAYEGTGQFDFLFASDVATQGRLADVEPTNSIPDAKTISVRTVRLDDYVLEGWLPPQLLKIDVEGGAGAVIRGAHSVISRHRPAIYIELHGPEEQRAVGELLTTFGYKAETLSGSEVPDPTIGWINTLVCTPR